MFKLRDAALIALLAQGDSHAYGCLKWMRTKALGSRVPTLAALGVALKQLRAEKLVTARTRPSGDRLLRFYQLTYEGEKQAKYIARCMASLLEAAGLKIIVPDIGWETGKPMELPKKRHKKPKEPSDSPTT